MNPLRRQFRHSLRTPERSTKRACHSLGPGRRRVKELEIILQCQQRKTISRKGHLRCMVLDCAHYSSAPSLSGLHGCPFYAFLCFLFHGYAWASFNAPPKRGQVFGPFNSSSFNVKYLIFIKIPFPNNYPKLRFSTNFQNFNFQLIFKTPIFKFNSSKFNSQNNFLRL